MAKYLVEDTSLAAVANAIRTKANILEPLAFPEGFVEAVEGITTGGGGAQMASGAFTVADAGSVAAIKLTVTHDLGVPPIGVLLCYKDNWGTSGYVYPMYEFLTENIYLAGYNATSVATIVQNASVASSMLQSAVTETTCDISYAHGSRLGGKLLAGATIYWFVWG